MQKIDILGEFPVVEFRRYRISAPAREHFACYFDTFFPEAIQQTGGVVLGQFLEGDSDEGFTWIRGFHDMEARATVNAALYDGPVWKEHRSTMNEHMLDHTNVLLMAPLRRERAIPVLAAVDPVRERDSSRGLAIAQVFGVKSGGLEDLVRLAEPVFATYVSQGAREAGILVSLDVPNNFPRLPYRTDGLYVVWLGMVENDGVLSTRLRPAAEQAQRVLADSGLLKSTPELIVLHPTARSRLRWAPPT